MKKNIIYSLLMLLPLMAFLNSCEDENIIFDHELPQFELRDNSILLEVIVPQGTTADDKLYIAGPFNGDSLGAVSDARWQLEKAQGNDVKWGIYLDPATFVDGKTLADGFYFISANQGVERTLKNEEAMHYDNPVIGTRTNITVNRWKAYFDTPVNPDEIEHDGFVIYVDDQTGWDELYMYMWGDVTDLNGVWPGATPTGTIKIGEITYKYFDTGADNAGLNENLIFNNNNGKQLADFNVTLDHDVYLTITADGVTETGEPSKIQHDGHVIYIQNKTTWDAITLYMWGDVNDLNGAWPGMQPTGTEVLGGITYTYFDMGEANTGLSENLIFNNNGGGIQHADFPVILDKDYFLIVTDDGISEVGSEEPVTPPTPSYTDYTIYVEDNNGWEDLAIYAWGDREVFGGWPGAASTGTQTIGGKTFKTFTMSAAGENINIIFNSTLNATQFDGPAIVANKDYYFTIEGSTCTEIDPVTLGSTYRIYVDDQTGWNALTIYAWGDKEAFNGWPGAAPAGSAIIEGKTYKYFEISGAGESVNLIFNNADGGIQFDGPNITINRDYYFTVTASACTEIQPSTTDKTYRIYVNDKSGWDSTTIYAWGDKEAFGGWPGATPTGTETINGETFKYWDVTGNGESINLIFNNAGAGVQFDGPSITIDKNYYYEISASECKTVTVTN